MCFAKQNIPLATQIGLIGLKAQTQSIVFFGRVRSSPWGWAEPS